MQAFGGFIASARGFEGASMRGILAQPGTLVIRLVLILCAVMDFTGTFLLCLITVGIGWCGWYASELIALIERAGECQFWHSAVTTNNLPPPRVSPRAPSGFLTAAIEPAKSAAHHVRTIPVKKVT
jgi:hypothetical protein